MVSIIEIAKVLFINYIKLGCHYSCYNCDGNSNIDQCI